MLVVVPQFDRSRSAVEDAIRRPYWKRYDTFLSFAEAIVAELNKTGRPADSKTAMMIGWPLT